MQKVSFLLKLIHYSNIYPLSLLSPDVLDGLATYFLNVHNPEAKISCDKTTDITAIKEQLAEGLAVDVDLRVSDPNTLRERIRYDIPILGFSLLISGEPRAHWTKRMLTDPNVALWFEIELSGFPNEWFSHPLLGSILIDLGLQSPMHALSVNDTLILMAGPIAAELLLRRAGRIDMANEVRTAALIDGHKYAILC